MTGLVSTDGRVDLKRPRVNAPLDIGDLGIPLGPEELGDPEAATAMVAMNQDRQVAGISAKRSGTVAIGMSRAPGIWQTANSLGSRTSINRGG